MMTRDHAHNCTNSQKERAHDRAKQAFTTVQNMRWDSLVLGVRHGCQFGRLTLLALRIGFRGLGSRYASAIRYGSVARRIREIDVPPPRFPAKPDGDL
ncbi:MAG: hypothetical protein ACYDEV_18025 [Acidiferrobacter sp.]